MEKGIKNNSYNGISSLLMVFLVKCNYIIVDTKNIAINDQSILVGWEHSDAAIDWKKPPASQRIPGIEITFMKETGKTQVVRYFNINVSDDNLKTRNTNFIPYIEKTINYATMLKSASYLLHYDNYTKIRSTIIKNSNFIVQDDSGIPLRYLNNNEWNISTHGVYNQPISLFSNRKQSNLKQAFNDSTGVLPFSYGYNYKPGESNLLIARKITSAPQAANEIPVTPVMYKSDFRTIENSALQGNINSQYHLGWLYYNGIDVQKSEDMAAQWYQKAADQGHAEAQSWLGFMYAEGRGVQQSYIQAGKWYQKAADQGHAEAKQNLARIKGYAN
jgi:hypothetical protein